MTEHTDAGRVSPGPQDKATRTGRPRPEWPQREPAPGGISAALHELRFVNERPCSLSELLAIAQRGAWTIAASGRIRSLAVVHVWIVQAPLLAIGTFIAWTARTAGRVWTVAPLVLTLCTALNLIPVVDLVIPDWLTWPYWPPLSWLL
jgi:hypothetical protein